MNEKRYRYILYAIVLVIVATIGIQVYWNYKNYLSNRQQLVNDVQSSLDKAVDDYYSAIAKETKFGFEIDENHQKDLFDDDSQFVKILESLDEKTGEFNTPDSIKIENLEGITLFRGERADSLMTAFEKTNKTISQDSFKNKILSLRATDSSLTKSSFELFTSKVFISISNDSLDISKVDSLLQSELERKKINVGYRLKYFGSFPKIDGIDGKIWMQKNAPIKNDSLRTFSNSALLPKDSALKIQFANETKVVLKRILGGILISTLLVLAVIGCLFYLLKIIREQKQLAEIKNDLISNITHEFKTPISTIGVALESLNNFNALEDKTKAKNYIDMSSQQLGKLNLMVEKLLETATLDSENLNLKKEDVDTVVLIETMIERYKLHHPEHTFKTQIKTDEAPVSVDLFHFENALNNILDNAVKYGGHSIWVDVSRTNESTIISIADNGQGIPKANQEKIFEKFYRVPKGNTHDVKGFGIGLYYTKTIIEKHGGTINLKSENNLTTFKISIPNG